MSSPNNNIGNKYNKNSGTRRNNNFGQHRRNNGEHSMNGDSNAAQQRHHTTQQRRKYLPAEVMNTENGHENKSPNEINHRNNGEHSSNCDVHQGGNNVAQQRHYAPHHRRNYVPAIARNTKSEKSANETNQSNKDVPQQQRQNYAQHKGQHGGNNSMQQANVRSYRHNNYYQRGSNKFVQQNRTDVPNKSVSDMEPQDNTNVSQQEQNNVAQSSYRNALLTNICAQPVADENKPNIRNEVQESKGIISEHVHNTVAPENSNDVQQINTDVQQFINAEPQSCILIPQQVCDNILPYPSYNIVPYVDDYVEPKATNLFLTPTGGFHIINFINLDKYGQEFFVPSCFNLGLNTTDENHILLDRVKKQLEFYLSEENLITDEFLKKLINSEGWVQIKDIMPFKRLQGLTKELNVILYAVMSSQKLELSQDNRKIRRKV